MREQIRSSIENVGDTRVADLYVWSVGSQGYAAARLSPTNHARPRSTRR